MKLTQRILFTALLVLSSLAHATETLPDSTNLHLQQLNKKEQIDYLISLSKQYKLKNGDLSLMFAREATKRASHLKTKKYLAEALIAEMNAYDILANYDSIENLANQLNELNPDEGLTIESNYLLSKAQLKKGEYEDAGKNIERVLKYFVSTGDSNSIYDVAKIQADLYTQQGNYPKAILSVQRALSIAENKQDTAKIISALSSMGVFYIRTGDFKIPKKYFLQAFKLSTKQTYTTEYKTLLSHMGAYYSRIRNYDSAKIFILHGLELSKKMNKRDDIAGAYLNLGNLYARQRQFSIGKNYFDESLKLFGELGLEINRAYVYDSYSVMYAVQGKMDSSILFAKKSLEIAEKLGNADKIKSGLYSLARGYDRLGDYKSSLDYAKKYILLTDSIVGEEIQSKIADYEAKYETAKKERDIIQLKAEKQAQKDKEVMLWISFLGALTVLLLVVLIISQRRKKDRIIYKQQDLVHKQEQELANAKLEQSKLKEIELQNEILYKSKQLTTHALNMMQKNTLMQEIQEELQTISKKSNSTDKASYGRLKSLIKRNMNSEKDWEVFKLYFEDVNEQFYAELEKTAPGLSANDQKLCALLKLNLNIKEAASVLNIEPASVKTARYKLRKKLGLDPETDLQEFIRKIG
ncbi:MAG: hypothetical protein JW729_06850 [Bacteroidales bacterium]|nr:hypothetical protein [Bacteroidales bacterium]